MLFKMRYLLTLTFLFSVLLSCESQMPVEFPFSVDSLRQVLRLKNSVPAGRKASIRDVRILFYGDNSTETTVTYRFSTIKRLLTDKDFDLKKPTVVYVHGYVEVVEDESVQTVVQAYLTRGGYNLLVLDWSNLAFGFYTSAARNVKSVGRETGRALGKLVAGGLNQPGIHLVGHSLGAHVVSEAARYMADNGMMLSRITGLDPALPGYYPPLALIGSAMHEDDATFVDVIHTDGGRYGTPLKTGHADFWPNGGTARQPGCPINSILLSYEDFCSHWRSWHFWAESVTGGEFHARECTDYDDFTRGACADGAVNMMGLQATKGEYTNYYLRTAPNRPYALGARGAV